MDTWFQSGKNGEEDRQRSNLQYSWLGGLLRWGRKTKGQKPWILKIQPFLFKGKNVVLKQNVHLESKKWINLREYGKTKCLFYLLSLPKFFKHHSVFELLTNRIFSNYVLRFYLQVVTLYIMMTAKYQWVKNHLLIKHFLEIKATSLITSKYTKFSDSTVTYKTNFSWKMVWILHICTCFISHTQ